MINELLVYQGNTSYKIDLYESETIDLTKSITDIVDPEQRRSDYTRTIKVPGTSNNNKVFSFIFDLSRYTINTTETQYNPDFNVALKTSAILYRNGLVQIKGFIQLTNIVKRPDGAVDYETTTVTCLTCGSATHRQLSAPRINLEPFTGIFPSATSKWEKRRAEKLAQERKLNRDRDTA